VHTIFAEDCWHSRKLLAHYSIATHVKAYHAHNEAEKASVITSLLDRGLAVALVSDAGIPGVSDPGAVAVRAAIKGSHKVVPIPGPCAAITALVASGLSTTNFHFEGFLPAKTTARRRRLQDLRSQTQA
jgi:16S rRNA (cytidine1402-2'-O)-methyltransferase